MISFITDRWIGDGFDRTPHLRRAPSFTGEIALSNINYRRGLLATTMIGGALLAMAATPSFAQTTDQTAEVGEIVVTGSRIVRQDYVANSPVATVTAEQIQARGDVNVEQILNQLPQVVPGFSANSNNPANGSATVDLRGLGASRTLVLVNGRRFVPYDKSNAVDLNSIPASLIERVEVVSGGASATYGSDALAAWSTSSSRTTSKVLPSARNTASPVSETASSSTPRRPSARIPPTAEAT